MKKAGEANMAIRENIAFPEDARAWQQQLVRGVLRVLVIVAPLAAAAGSYYDYSRQELWTIPMYWGAYAVLVLITFWRRVPYTLQAGVIMALVYGLAILDFPTDGRGGSGRVFLLTLPFMAGLFFGLRASIFALVIMVLTMAGFGWAFSTGLITGYQEINSTDPIGWLSNTFVLFMLGTFMVVSHNYVVPRLVAALSRSRGLAQELEAHRVRLEEQVAERTADLARRTTELETAAQVARETVAMLDLQELLSRVVTLISERFGFYHTGIFLLDPSGEWAELQAASSEGGRRMLARGYRLRVGAEGIVGHVTGRNEPYIALDTGEGAAFFDDPDLPDTRSEIVLPLRARGEVIGALDVQSREPGAFSEEDVTVLQTLADQVALAISNARFFQQAQESLEAERRVYGELSRQAWQELLRARPGLGQRYDPQGILPTDGRWREEMKQAMKRGETILGADGPSATLAAPIKVRDQVIGALDAYKPEDAGEWTAEEIALLQTLADQLGMALESARLYQDTQRRAARDRLASEVVGRMREMLDVESVLQTAVDEIRQALRLDRTAVRLAMPETDGDLAAEGRER